MPFDQHLADRIRQIFDNKNLPYGEKVMFGGIAFMVDGKMCCGHSLNKKEGVDLIMARVGEEAAKKALETPGIAPMDFTGRPMKGYIFVFPKTYDKDVDLEHWIQLCLNFNPFAKASKKR